MADGSYGFGYEEASDGHLLVKYPKQGTSFNYAVTRNNGVVYFGEKATTCKWRHKRHNGPPWRLQAAVGPSPCRGQATATSRSRPYAPRRKRRATLPRGAA
jgi:hypothetical protein